MHAAVEADATELMKEIQILEDCDSPYVVGYLGSYMKDGDLWIVMEYCAAGSLTDLMTIANVTLGEKELQHAIAGTLLGLEYLHSTRLIHRVSACARTGQPCPPCTPFSAGHEGRQRAPHC